MKARAVFCALAIAVLATGARAAEDRWLHVRVDEKGDSGEKVRVNVPFELLEAIITEFDTERLSGGKISLDKEDVDMEELRSLLRAVRSAREGEYVRVEGVDGDVRVSKEGDLLHVRVNESPESEAEEKTVTIRLPMAVLEALASGEGEDLDVLAAIHALGDGGEGELVVVNDEDATVRVWVDKTAGGGGE